jgi:glycosyltransferase involved in cell wall biosynthesis
MNGLNGISIIIACYNSEKRLPDTLQHLANQRFSNPYEVIIIDNASTDNTTKVAKSYKERFGENYIVDYQPLPGKTNAINLALKYCKYKYVMIVDDDNWLCEDYLDTAYNTMESDLSIGALGGRGIPVFEKEPKYWAKNGYACGAQGNGSEDISDKQGWLYGAGCVYRLDVITELFQNGFQNVLATTRQQNVDLSGEDVELCYAIRLLGYKIWYNEKLVFKHYMPEARMSESKYLSLHRGDGVIAYTFDLYRYLLKKRKLVLTYPLWFIIHIRFIIYTIGYFILNLMSNKQPVIKQGKSEFIRYRLITAFNYNYCHKCFNQVKSNINIIAQIK